MNITIANAKVDQKVKVTKIKAGFKALHFLADLGIHEGEEIKIIKNNVGPVIVKVKGTRVALGRGLAGKIEVSEV